ncbi:MAG: hypothetical protein R3322_00270 [Kiloniellales bacterium]|nr:hypothetical protein [Kiloniellales bacterium]
MARRKITPDSYESLIDSWEDLQEERKRITSLAEALIEALDEFSLAPEDATDAIEKADEMWEQARTDLESADLWEDEASGYEDEVAQLAKKVRALGKKALSTIDQLAREQKRLAEHLKLIW